MKINPCGVVTPTHSNHVCQPTPLARAPLTHVLLAHSIIESIVNTHTLHAVYDRYELLDALQLQCARQTQAVPLLLHSRHYKSNVSVQR